MSKELEALRQLHMAGAYVSERLRNKITPSKATELKNVLYQAIKRNEPMQVIKTPDGYYRCPSCDNEVDVSNVCYDTEQFYRYCYHCGQKLYWNDEK